MKRYNTGEIDRMCLVGEYHEWVLAEEVEALEEQASVDEDFIKQYQAQVEALEAKLKDAQAHIRFLTERLDERPEPPERDGICDYP